ncbi:hypothetical protein [Actinomadura macrotermitis]|uniref:Uncharacterized protein n=1 Tax=Actinomadura macrotermitis TaxID=2585200 RepID=A0A7K0C841_9ACTN|nr:hypothetical protein [Actinomadura macrotermitis]MQY09641.1 hypothetical protein [Actinomadura macrotermitis]
MADRGPAPELAAERLTERIYATITMLAVLVGLSFAPAVSPGEAAATIAITALGLWLASLVAEVQAHKTVHGEPLDHTGLRSTLYVSSPLLLSAAGPLLMTGLAALGALGLVAALRVSIVLDVFSLFLWGFLGGRRMGNGPLVATLAGTADLVIGLAVVFVKSLAGH